MKIEKCRRCPASIVFLPTKTGKVNPVNAETVEEGDEMFRPKTKADPDGKHVSHFATCPAAQSFRR